MLSNTEQQRTISNISISDKPDYIITTHRPQAIKNDKDTLREYKLIHEIKVHGEVITEIYERL